MSKLGFIFSGLGLEISAAYQEMPMKLELVSFMP